MSDKKISELAAAGPLTGTEPFPVVQSGATKKSNPDAVVDYVVSETISQVITNGVLDKAPSEDAVFDALALKSNVGHTHVAADVTDFSTATDARITLQKGAANGLATLGGDSKIPAAQLPAIAITDTFVVASQAAQTALTAETGDIAVRTDLNKSYILMVNDPTIFANWQELLTPTDAVLSVNGFTGAVVLTTTDVAEGTNLYFTDLRAQTASISQVITNGVMDKAPSEDAVFDALAGKSDTTHAHTIDSLTDAVTDATSMYIGTTAPALTTGTNNTATGIDALVAVTSAEGATAYGFEALKANTTGATATAFGKRALTANTTGQANTAVGYQALQTNVAGGFNTAIGNSALATWNAAGTGANIAVGSGSLINLTTGTNNVSVGNNSMFFNLTGLRNTGVGFEAVRACTVSDNTGVGYQALRNSTTGDKNAAFGKSSLVNVTTGANNAAVGEATGATLTTGSDNILLGEGANVSIAAAANQIVLGKGATGAGDNTAQIGNASTTDVYFGNAGAAILHGDGSMLTGITGGATQLSGLSDAVNTNEGNGNVFIGSGTGNLTLSGTFNIGVGSSSMAGVTTANGCTFLGYQALNGVTSGSNNTGIGQYAGVNGTALTTGANNTLIGNDTRVDSAAASNRTALGYQATCTADNSIQLGNSSVTVVKCGDGTATINGTLAGAIASATTATTQSAADNSTKVATTAYADAAAAAAAAAAVNLTQNSQSAAYTTVLADANVKHILHPTADTTARTFTIDSNANVAYPIGSTLTFINQVGAGVLTIAITSDTMYFAGTASTTGSRTLAAVGVATALKVGTTEWIISGVNLT